MDNPKIKPHVHSPAEMPDSLIEDRAKILRWAYEYMDGDASTIEDHCWSYMAEQSLYDNRSHMSVHKDFPVEVDWEFAVFGDYFISDEKTIKEYPLVGWTWDRGECEAMMESFKADPDKYQNVKLYCRLSSLKMEVDTSEV